MDAKVKRTLLQKYLKEDVLKGRGAWPREMKIFNGISTTYPNEAFWAWYNPGFKLNSLAWFIGDGKDTLAAAHQSYLFELDNLSKTRKVDVKEEPVVDLIPATPNLKKPTNLISWLRNPHP